MKTKLIFICFFSTLFFSSVFAQKEEPKKVKWKYEPNFMVGLDLLNTGVSFFGDRKLYQGFVTSKIKKNVHAEVDLGYDKNVYVKNGYDVEASGIFTKLGGFYMLASDAENEFNGFYAGAKLGGAFYSQEYFSVPVRGYGDSGSTMSFDKSNQSSYWLEAAVGGRVQLFDSNFYIDVQAQPRYILFTTKQNDIVPMIVPGFGKSSTKFNVGFAWNIAYKF